MSNNKNNECRRRHCMIVHAYYPLGETRVQREAEVLLKNNFDVDVICLRKHGEPAIDYFKGVRIYRLPVRRWRRGGLPGKFFEYLAFFFLAMFKVTWLHWRDRYHTVQTHNPPDLLVFAAWMPRLFGAKVILDLHDLMPEFYTGRSSPHRKNFLIYLIRLQEHLSCRFAHHVITVSHHWRKALTDRGVASPKISVVMNVADDSIFRPPPNQPKQAQTNGSLHLIYHGTVAQRHGLDLVLQAMARLRQEAADIHFTILGIGDQVEVLMRLAKELNLDDQVTFHCRIQPAEELPEIIRKADAGIVPYRNDPFTDGLVPTKLLEYAALGLPSIAARTTAIAHYFDDSMVEFFNPGSVDELARCIARLHTDRARLEQLAQGIQRFTQLYNWKKFGAEYVALVGHLNTR